MEILGADFLDWLCDGSDVNEALKLDVYKSGVHEQLVMERTGHRSIDGIRSYKRTADFQRENI